MNNPGPGVVPRTLLKSFPDDFQDDGCSNAPDSFFGRDLRWCCRIHDWRYCSRGHSPGTMNQSARRFADKELGWNVRSVFRFGFRWLGWAYWRATHRFGGTSAWNSCGPQAGRRCRHNLLQPDWMTRLPQT